MRSLTLLMTSHPKRTPQVLLRPTRASLTPSSRIQTTSDSKLPSPDPDLTLGLVLALAAEVLPVSPTTGADLLLSLSSWTGVTTLMALLRIRVLTLDTITPRILISQKVLPPGWLFSKRTGRAGQLDPALYLPELITERNVTDLYLDDPWEALDLDSTKPLTFDPDLCPPLAAITDEFFALAKDHKQAIWESTHSFPIPRSKQTAEPWAASFYSGRMNRSSHAREKFRAWEDRVFELIRRTGCCDLDVLLDPVFLRFPQQSEETTWFPGREALAEGRPAPKSLKAALRDCDQASAWRNHYRMNPGSHPALKIRRLRLKFTHPRIHLPSC
ncbi:hypothetical protein PR001_g24716 [Phytophthora rubi]|uniref:Uncharacterized protein n=1 Tax=Phytophthora rubi TaxID=129364 RepID=A0A6A3I7T4_9STRA|nr:hypothetical protein PR001_g24716 [Phytophthora rubi]